MVGDLATGDVLRALAGFEATAVRTAELSAELDVPVPYLTTHLQQLALTGLVGFDTHEGVRRWRLTAAGRAALAGRRGSGPDTGATGPRGSEPGGH